MKLGDNRLFSLVRVFYLSFLAIHTALPGSFLYKQALDKGYQLPDSYVGYSFHAYETLPMPTDFLTPAEVLEFRDKAFITYHSHPEFLARIESKFGKIAVDNIQDMLKISLKRKIIEAKDSRISS